MSGIFYNVTVYGDLTDLSNCGWKFISRRISHAIQPFIVKNDVTSVRCTSCCKVQGRYQRSIFVTQSWTFNYASVWYIQREPGKTPTLSVLYKTWVMIGIKKELNELKLHTVKRVLISSHTSSIFLYFHHDMLIIFKKVH